jgi:hypothetical protein
LFCGGAQEVRRFAAQANAGVEMPRPFQPVCTLDYVLKFDEELSSSAVASGAMGDLLLGLGECKNPLIQKDLVKLIEGLCHSHFDASRGVMREVSLDSQVGPAVWAHMLSHLDESAGDTSEISGFVRNLL